MTDKELRKVAEQASVILLRLADEAGSLLDGEERDMIGRIRFACDEISDGDRGGSHE